MNSRSNKQTQINEILTLMQRHDIKVDDLAAQKPTSSTMVWIFGYIGGLFIVGGVGFFLDQNWENFTSLQRIIISYGMGTLLFTLSCVLYVRHATPAVLHNLFVISAVLMSIGLGVAIAEVFPKGDSISLFILAISGAMLFQYFMTFIATRLISVLFMTLVFAVGTYVSAIDVLYEFNLVPTFAISAMSNHLIVLVGSLSLLGVTYVISQGPFRKISGIWFFVASATFYSIVYRIFEHDFKMEEAFFLALLPGIYLSKLANSKALMITSAIAFISYLGLLNNKYFSDTPWWPVSLICIGLITIALAYWIFQRMRNDKSGVS